MNIVEENLKVIKGKIEKTCLKVNRNPQEIVLVAVSKGQDIEKIKLAINAGITEIGENYFQEAKEKIEEISNFFPTTRVSWHFIGHLQRNKVKYVLPLFSLIQSVDNYELAWEISKRSEAINIKKEILIEVNTSEEETKFGLTPDKTKEFIKEIANLSGIKIKGLMTIGPFTEDLEKIRNSFRRLKILQEDIINEKILNIEMQYLSMGMSADFEIALEEGANIIRIGTGIFGPRAQKMQ